MVELMEISEMRRLAAVKGISLNYIAKDEMISRALFQLQGQTNIIFKGGTAINRVYIKNKRFSEDIDLDFISEATVREALPKTSQIISSIKGFQIARPRIMKSIIRYDLFYQNPLNHKDKIRIEFNVIKKAARHSSKIINYGYVPFDSSLMATYDIDEFIRQKIGCVLGRVEGKDLFDLYHLLKLNKSSISIQKETKNELIKRITLDDKSISSIANSTNHYIPKDSRPKWQMFIQEIKEMIRLL